eukprot:scaffold79867_cov54-Attheya_sp.AAC.4
MKFVKSVLSVSAVLLSANVAFGKEYKRMKQAGQDPAMLAQLMEDMKDPELMREAQEMMNSPEFKKQMKKMQNSKEFKDASKKATDMMSDPGTAAKLTAKMEHMVQRGQDSLKKGAANSMKDAFDAFQNPDVMAEAAQMMRDPDFKKNMANMAKDPAFKNYIAAVRDMPSFILSIFDTRAMSCQWKNQMYRLVSHSLTHSHSRLDDTLWMQDMMQDPSMKNKIDELSNTFRSAL